MQDVSYHNEATPQPGRKNFAIVPSRIIFDDQLSERAVRILMAIASYANKDRLCQVRQDVLARRLRMHRVTINNTVELLALHRYLRVSHTGKEMKGTKGGRGTNVYQLLFDVWGNPFDPNDGPRVGLSTHDTPSEHHGGYVAAAQLNSGGYVAAQIHNPVSNVVPPLHNLGQLSSPQTTQAVMSSGDYSTGGGLCSPTATALTEYREERTESDDIDVSALGTSPETKVEQEGYDARARAEDITTSLRAHLDPQKHQRHELWQRVIGVLNVPKSQRQEWLDPCSLYEPTTHNFLLVAPTRAEKQHVDLLWGVAIWCELQKMLRAECTLALDYGAPPNAKQRSISA